MLRRHWPADGAVVVRDMAPLNRDDVLQAAEARGIPDPEGFAAGLEQRGLVPVASPPADADGPARPRRAGPAASRDRRGGVPAGLRAAVRGAQPGGGAGRKG